MSAWRPDLVEEKLEKSSKGGGGKRYRGYCVVLLAPGSRVLVRMQSGLTETGDGFSSGSSEDEELPVPWYLSKECGTRGGRLACDRIA